jgi:hypothetical protein
MTEDVGNTPTSLTLHEPSCAKRTCAHATNCQLFTFPCLTPERLN